TLFLEADQCRIKRTLVHDQHILRNLLNALRDAPSVHGFQRQCFEDQHIEGSLQQVDTLFFHLCFPFKWKFGTEENSEPSSDSTYRVRNSPPSRISLSAAR